MRPEDSAKTHNSTARHTPRGEDRQALASVCRSAVRRWFARPEVIGALTTAAVARYAARPRRPAALYGHHGLPAMRRGVWYRLAQLVRHRAELEFGPTRPGPKPKGSAGTTATAAAPSPAQIQARAARDAAAEWRRAFTTRPVRQMIGFLGDYAAADGRIDNVGRMIACYRKMAGCSEATAYAHWRTVRELGLVRQTRHSAGHRPAAPDGASTRHARYVLCWPPAMLPEHLPVQATGWAAAPLADAAGAWNEDGAERLAADDALGLVGYGSCRDAARRPVAAGETSTGSDPHGPDDRPGDDLGRRALYYLEACPLYARVPPPSPPTRSEPEERRRPRGRPGRLTDDDRAAARAIMSRCRSRWAEQGHDSVNEDELAQLTSMIALVLRYSAHLGPSDLVDYLTERVGSAADLVAVLRHRLQRLINSLRRRANVRVDEQRADRSRARAAAQAAVRSAQTASLRAQARAELEAARRRAAAKRALAPPRPVAAGAGAAEPEEAFAQELAARGIADPERDLGRFTRHEAEAMHWAEYNTRPHHGGRRRIPPPPLSGRLAELDHLPHHR